MKARGVQKFFENRSSFNMVERSDSVKRDQDGFWVNVGDATKQQSECVGASPGGKGKLVRRGYPINGTGKLQGESSRNNPAESGAGDYSSHTPVWFLEGCHAAKSKGSDDFGRYVSSCKAFGDGGEGGEAGIVVQKHVVVFVPRAGYVRCGAAASC